MKKEIFQYEKINVRTAFNGDDILFCINDVGRVLGLSNPYRQVKDFKEGVHTMHTLTNGGMQDIIYINEPCLYELIFKSRKQNAVKFKKWIFSEVLPSIRKTGEYSIKPSLKKLSTESRNALTDMWKEHGCDKPYHYSNLTKKEYKLLFDDDKKRKSNMTKGEILALNALESMEALSLFKSNKMGYYECSESLDETIKKLPKENIKELK